MELEGCSCEPRTCLGVDSMISIFVTIKPDK